MITLRLRLVKNGDGIFMSASGRFNDLMPGSPDCGRPMSPT